MKLLFFLLLFIPGMAMSQVYISGNVLEMNTGEPLIGVHVLEQKSNLITTTNNYGFFRLSVPSGNVALICYYQGRADTLNYFIASDSVINIRLDTQVELNEVAVFSNNGMKSKGVSNVFEIPMKKVEQMPSFMGEPDIVKTIQLLPGVQAGNEGSASINVRGGSPDQNLVLLDDVPVYNTNHLGGYFSVFNNDAIKNVNFIKGGMPARYSGRLSSVLDVRMKDGDNQKYSGAFSIGTLSAKLMVEGPLIKEKSSFLVSVRRSYFDLMVSPIMKKISMVDAGLYFYDINAKINYQLPKHQRLYVSFYKGKDKFYGNQANGSGDSYKNSFDWGNTNASLKLVSPLGKKLYNNVSVFWSDYQQNTQEEVFGSGERTVSEQMYQSNINTWAAKDMVDYELYDNWKVKFGAKFLHHRLNPGQLTFTSFTDSTSGNFAGASMLLNEGAIFAENCFSLGKFDFNLGLNASLYAGNDWSSINFEPRVGLYYHINEKTGWNLSFDKTTQALGLLPTTMVGIPMDIWVPANEKLPPQYSYQLSSGLNTSFDKYSFSIDIYGKQLHNQLSFKDGASQLVMMEGWKDNLCLGTGRAYGVELLFEKTVGATKGWVSYTYSRSFRTFDELNGGKEYPYIYDRPHNLAITLNHKFNDKISLSANWQFYSGTNLTMPLGQYTNLPIGEGEPAFSGGGDIETAYDYTEKNNYRLPNYHRLDIGLSFFKPLENYDRTWSFGVYNVYNQKNTFTYNVDYDINNPSDVYIDKLTLFPVMPYVRYSLKF